MQQVPDYQIEVDASGNTDPNLSMDKTPGVSLRTFLESLGLDLTNLDLRYLLASDYPDGAVKSITINLDGEDHVSGVPSDGAVTITIETDHLDSAAKVSAVAGGAVTVADREARVAFPLLYSKPRAAVGCSGQPFSLGGNAGSSGVPLALSGLTSGDFYQFKSTSPFIQFADPDSEVAMTAGTMELVTTQTNRNYLASVAVSVTTSGDTVPNDASIPPLIGAFSRVADGSHANQFHLHFDPITASFQGSIAGMVSSVSTLSDRTFTLFLKHNLAGVATAPTHFTDISVYITLFELNSAGFTP